MNKKSIKWKVLITSLILTWYVASAFAGSTQALMNNISNNEVLNNVAIEQSIENKETSNSLLSTIFWIPKASAADYDLNQVYNDLQDIKWTTFEKVIIQAYSLWIIKGYSEEKKFKPDNWVSYIESLAIIYNTLDKKLEVPKYVSGNDSHWSDKYKSLYVDQDKTNLRTYTNDTKINRDFAIYLMLRSIWIEFNDSDYSLMTNKFNDVKITSKFAPYLAFAGMTWISNWYSEGALAGWFWVNEKITRWETTAFTFKVLSMKSELQSKYKELTWRAASIESTKTPIIENQKTSTSSSSTNTNSSSVTNDTSSSGTVTEKKIANNHFTKEDWDIMQWDTEILEYWSEEYIIFKNKIFKDWKVNAWVSRSVSTNVQKLGKIEWMDYDKLYTEKEKFEWYKKAIEKEWLSDYFYINNNRWTIWNKTIWETVYFRFDFTRTEKSKINDLYSTDLIIISTTAHWKRGYEDLWKTTWSLTTVLGFFSQR